MVHPLPLEKLRSRLAPSRSGSGVVSALAHVAAHGRAARVLVPRAVAWLRVPSTTDAAATALWAMGPLPESSFAEVADLVTTAESPAVRAAAASVLGSFGTASAAAVPVLEQHLAAGDPRTWLALLAIDPDHPQAVDALIADWQRSGLDWIHGLLAVSRVPERFWAAVEQRIVAGEPGAWTALWIRYDDPGRTLGIVRRAVTADGAADLASGLSTSHFATFARRTVARLAATGSDEVDPETVAVLLRTAERLAREANAYDLDELGVLVAGVTRAGTPRERVDALLLDTLRVARERYARFEEATQRLVANVAEALAAVPDAGGDEGVRALAVWVREPEVGRVVARVLESRGEAVPRGAARYWRPEPELPPIPPPARPRLIVAGEDERRNLALTVARGYDTLRIDPNIEPLGLERLLERLGQARMRLLDPTGLPPAIEELAARVLGDLLVRGSGWRWASVDAKATREEKLLRDLFGEAEPRERPPAVVSPSGRRAVDLRAVLVDALRYLTLETVTDAIVRERGLAAGTPTRPEWIVRA
jgi:hypothetical protein